MSLTGKTLGEFERECAEEEREMARARRRYLRELRKRGEDVLAQAIDDDPAGHRE